MTGWSKDCSWMKSMFGNFSELSALVFIGIAVKCLKSWLHKPYWKFLILPCIKWDSHLIQVNLKVKLTNVSKSDGAIIAWISVNMIKCHKRPHDKIMWTQQFRHFVSTLRVRCCETEIILWMSNVNYTSAPIINSNIQKFSASANEFSISILLIRDTSRARENRNFKNLFSLVAMVWRHTPILWLSSSWICGFIPQSSAISN